MPETNPDSGQLFMPGPQFSQKEPPKSWFGRYSNYLVIGIIVVLLAVGGGYFYKSYQQRKAALKPALENIIFPTATPSAVPSPTTSPSITKTPSAKIFSPATSPTLQPQKETTPKISPPGMLPEISKTDNQIIAKAAKGNGATHLARYALKEYLKERPELAASLKAEQKIYIEDYLQKHTSHPQILKVGSEISFSDNLLKDAIERAQKLTDSQINNLSKYVPLVPSL